VHDHPRRGTPARPRRWRRPYLPALVGVLLALGVAACGGGSSDNGDGVASLVGADSATSTTTANAGEDVDPAQAARNYGRCMRQHGIELPDPQVDADGGLDMEIPRSVNRDAPKFKAADQACGRYLPPRENAPPNPQQRQQALAFARCMRQHGINLPDPQLSGNGITQQLPRGLDPDDPRLSAAEHACHQYGSLPPINGPQRGGGSK
jgi:hypothetical protein